jgi:hypothetical protein
MDEGHSEEGTKTGSGGKRRADSVEGFNGGGLRRLEEIEAEAEVEEEGGGRREKEGKR